MTDGKEVPRHASQDDDAGQGDTQPGIYELCNIFGTPAGRRIVVAPGQAMPQIPHGWSWRHLGSS